MTDDVDRKFQDGIKRLKLSSVPRRIQWKLAWHLDGHCNLANWKGLAEKYGLPTPMIMSIEDRVCYTSEKSCTLLLFKECFIPNKITLDQLVQLLAVIKNLACIHVLKEAFYKGHLRTSNENKTNVTNQQTQSLPAVIDGTANEGHLRTSNENKTNETNQQTQSLPAVIDGTANENAKNQAKKIFITYSEDSRKMAKLIYKWLMCQRCIVSLDIFESRLLQENRIGWYDKKFREADHIMILVSPQYAEDIGHRGTSDLSPITLYIHNRMQAEYLKNNCTNKRFIPIVLPGAMKDQGPEWLMLNTIPYHWPHHYEDVYRRIHDLLMPPCVKHQNTPIIRKSRT